MRILKNTTLLTAILVSLAVLLSSCALADMAFQVDYESDALSNDFGHQVLFDEQGVRLEFLGMRYDTLLFKIENSTDYMNVNVKTSIIALNNVSVYGEGSISTRMGDSEAFECFIDLFSYSGMMAIRPPEIANIPIECIALRIDIQIGSTTDWISQKVMLTSGVYNEADMERIKGVKIADMNELSIPASIYSIETNDGIGFSLCNEGTGFEQDDWSVRVKVAGGYMIDQRIRALEEGMVQFYHLAYSPEELRMNNELPASVPLKVGIELVSPNNTYTILLTDDYK